MDKFFKGSSSFEKLGTKSVEGSNDNGTPSNELKGFSAEGNPAKLKGGGRFAAYNRAHDSLLEGGDPEGSDIKPAAPFIQGH